MEEKKLKDFTHEDIMKMTDDNYKVRMNLPEDYKFKTKEEMTDRLLEILDSECVLGFPNMDIAAYLIAALLNRKDEMEKRDIVRFELKNCLTTESLLVIAEPIFDPFNTNKVYYLEDDIIHSSNRDILFEQFKINIMENISHQHKCNEEEHTDNE